MEPILTEPPTSGPLLRPGDPYSTTTSQMDSATTTADQQGLQPSQEDASGWSPSASSSMVESPVAVPAYNSTGGPGSFPLEDDLQLPASNSSSHFSQYSSSGYNGDPYYYSGGSQRSTLDGDDGGMPGSNIHFVYANERRFQDFHALFRSVPEDERLIEDYGCALQKEILVQGRLYISENHVCFNANIFGWVTNLVIAFSEITAIEKRLTAFVIPNAISIVTTTNTKGHFFASFLSRDSAYDLLMAAWRKSFPCAANAPTNGNNAYFRQNRSNLTLENGGNGSGSGGAGTGEDDDDGGDDAQSFISARGPSAGDSRRNRHRRTFSNNSQNWTADEAEYDDMDDAERSQSGGASVRRRGSKRATVRKILKEVISPNKADEDSSAPSTPSKRTGRVRSVSELPPPPSNFDTGRRESMGSARPSFENNALLPHPTPNIPQQTRPRAGTEALMPPNTHPAATNGHARGASMPGKASSTAKQPPKSAPSGASKPPSPVRKATTCSCSKDGKHYSGNYLNEIYPGSVEAIWKLLFASDFTKSFLTSEVMKGADVQEESWKSNSDGTQTKVTRYIKWLGMPIGPKTTKATLTDVCEHKDFDDYVTTVTTTSTPDVPAGNCFSTKNRTCITWAGPNQVRVVVTGAVEFTKGSWLKGQIEKGAADGMATHYRELNQAVRKHIASHPDEFAAEPGSTLAANGAPAGTMPAAAANGSANPSSPRPSGKAKQANGVRPANPTQNGDSSMIANGGSALKGPSSSTSATGGSASTSSSSILQHLLDLKQTLLQGLSEMMNPGHKATSATAGTAAAGAPSSESSLMNPLLLSILVLVMMMNIYIWWQISSVTHQMERIQSEILEHHLKASQAAVHRFHYHQPQTQQPPQFASHSSSSPPSFDDQHPNDSYDNNNNAHDFWEEEEEAMWAWLTERDTLNQRAQGRRAAAAASKGSSSSPPSSSASAATSSSTSKDASLQARMRELQQQLEALESRARMLEHQEEQASSEFEPLP